PERSQWKFTFVPSRELEAQGITIDSVREELSRVGEILKASPSVKDNGELSFELMVVAENAPSDMAGWEAKGIRAELEPVEEATGLPGNATPSETEHTPFLAPSHLVRVDLNRLDELMRITGEMVIHRSRLESQLARLSMTAGRSDLRGVQEV